jgi:thioredoxin reductase
MESLVIWGLTLLLAAFIILPYFLNHRRRQKEDTKRQKEAVYLGVDKAITQHPHIDYLRCIGCGSCVAACPEGGVLGIVNGKAAIINGLKCVGHGLCAEACPVEGITIGLGDVKNREDIPLMDESNETNIPGIYIAGELGGLALIRNAISQGRMVIEKIAGKLSSSNDPAILDVIIIGAGPAGLSAALTAIEHNLKYLVIDQQQAGGTILQYPRKKLVMTRPVELPMYGWLNKPEYSKEELLGIWDDILPRYHVDVRSGEKLVNAVRENNRFIVQTSRSAYSAHNLVLALGRRGTPRKLGVPGEDQAKVMYKLLDAEGYKNEPLLVVGGGDSAIEAAIGLARQPGNIVTLSYRKDKFFRVKRKNEDRIGEMIRSGSIHALFNSNLVGINKESVIIKTDEKSIELPNNYVFIFAGGEPPFDLLKKIGIRFGGVGN